MKKSYANATADANTLLLALAVDRLTWLVWSQTKDGQKGRNRPESLYEALMNGPKEKEIKSFQTPHDFEKAWNAIIKKET